MIIYRSTKKGFISDVFNGIIADEINEAFYFHLGRYTTDSEYMSWKNSMMYMNNVVNTYDIPDDSDIAIEYHIPLMSKRIDFIISGLDENKESQVIIIELKQWSTSTLTKKSGVVKTRFQHGETETAHPSYQAWSYAYMLEHYNEAVQEQKINLVPCAYLHNYETDDTITNSFYQEYIEKAPLFLKSDAKKLQDFIKKHIKYASKNDILWSIENGRLRPSKHLADSLCSMLEGNQEFILLDDQKVVYETALEMARLASSGKKQVLIVEGGPGTGKSVIAINLLVELTKQNLVTQYVSKNSAPRAVYSAKLSGRMKKTVINNLFVGSGNFTESESNMFDSLIVDEAHRLNLKSGLYSNLVENQIVEIINAAKFSIFFVDDRQKIHIKDIGSKKEIEKCADKAKADVRVLKLSSQFRCNGSDGYLAWLDNTLQIKETANINLNQDDYDFQVFNDPNELFFEIAKKNTINNKSRVVAGYCWDWKSKKDSKLDDIIIEEFNFKKKWNLSDDGSKWIIAENSINEIGCIHTCQGLELDYVGVIIGNDLRYEDNRIISDVLQRSSNDKSIRGFKKLLKEDKTKALQESSELIKNTYRTLMTRGMKGCYVYFCDPNLASHFSRQLTPSQKLLIDTIRVEPEINDDVRYVDFLPFYSMKAACGYFGEGENVEELGWVKIEGVGKLNRNMFVIRATGNSMEPLIKDNDYCVFRSNIIGSRQGKVVLVEHRNFYDSDNSGSYSIKKYSSEKKHSETGEWEHERIILEPRNKTIIPLSLKKEMIILALLVNLFA